jgi:hypothetical protein
MDDAVADWMDRADASSDRLGARLGLMSHDRDYLLEVAALSLTECRLP